MEYQERNALSNLEMEEELLDALHLDAPNNPLLEQDIDSDMDTVFLRYKKYIESFLIFRLTCKHTNLYNVPILNALEGGDLAIATMKSGGVAANRTT
jgi:hypothetical protein